MPGNDWSSAVLSGFGPKNEANEVMDEENCGGGTVTTDNKDGNEAEDPTKGKVKDDVEEPSLSTSCDDVKTDDFMVDTADDNKDTANVGGESLVYCEEEKEDDVKDTGAIADDRDDVPTLNHGDTAEVVVTDTEPTAFSGMAINTPTKKNPKNMKHAMSIKTTSTGRSSFADEDDSDGGGEATTMNAVSRRSKWLTWPVLAIVVLLAVMVVCVGLAAKGSFSDDSSPTTLTHGPQHDGGDDETTPVGDPHDTEKPPLDDENESHTSPPYKVNYATPANETNTLDFPTPLGPISYAPGLLTVQENGLLLSEGLTSRMLAERRKPVQYANGGNSTIEFHRRPDYGACFAVPPDVTEYPQGGWVYVSNSELGGGEDMPGMSGVGAIYFDPDGNVLEYKMLLTNSTKNCAGGRTPWNTFVSCEEARDIGHVWQIDPFDRRPPEQITMGALGGRYEAFASDDRDKRKPRFFITEDLSNGPTVRWTPHSFNVDWSKPWDILTGSGTLEYLVLHPNHTDNQESGTFEWTRNLTLARENAGKYARGTEGIDRKDNLLYFVCKTDKLFYILDLDRMTFIMRSTVLGLFDGEPDILKQTLNANDTQDILYFTEASDDSSGVHGRNSKGQFFTIMEAPGWEDASTTGLAFSPNGLHMYVTLQDPGVLFEITRTDGRPFHGSNLEVHYHNPPLDHLLLRHV